MEILKIIVLALGVSLTYILITLITSFLIYRKKSLGDLINWKIVLLNSLRLGLLFFIIFWGLELLFSSLLLSEMIMNIILFLTIAIVPSYEYLISPLITTRNENLVEINSSQRIKNTTDKIKIFKIKKEFANAYAIGVLPNTKSVIISEDLLREMNPLELDGIISHEIGHLKKNHLFKIYLSALFALLIGYLSSFYIYPIIENSNYNIHILRAVHISFVYGLPMWIIPALFQRKFEYQADAYAAKIVGKENYINSLKKLDKMANGAVTKGGITHPSLKKRIQNICRQ